MGLMRFEHASFLRACCHKIFISKGLIAARLCVSIYHLAAFAFGAKSGVVAKPLGLCSRFVLAVS